MLKGLEEQDEEEQLLPVLPVFLLRWPWLCELSFLDFPSLSLLLWWLEDICSGARGPQQLLFSQNCGFRSNLTLCVCVYLLYAAAGHRRAQAV